MKVILIALLFFLSNKAMASGLKCEGVYFELKGRSDISFLELVEKVFGDDWNESFSHEASTSRITQNTAYELRARREIAATKYWNWYNLLRGEKVLFPEILCGNDELSMREKVTSNLAMGPRGSDDSECKTLNIPLSEGPACDHLWAPKMTGLLRQNARGLWSDNWMQELIGHKIHALTLKILQSQGELTLAEIELLYREKIEMQAFGKGVLIGLPDTGWTKHPELVGPGGKIDGPLNFAQGPSALDTLKGYAPGHGTSTGSIMVSLAGKEFSKVPRHVHGVAKRARIRPYRIADGGVVHFTYNHLIAAIESAILNNEKYTTFENAHKRVRVLNMSLGGPWPREKLRRVLQRAQEAGIITVAAAGNYIPDMIFTKYTIWPAQYPETIAMAATDAFQNPWVYSSKGGRIDMAAPGQKVWAAQTRLQDGQRTFLLGRSSGTSMATAEMSGAVALWIAFHGESKLKAYDPLRTDLLRYLLQKIHKKNGHIPIKCERLSESCGDVKEGLYGLGILNIPALLKEPLPTLKALKAWKAQQSALHRYFYLKLGREALENLLAIVNVLGGQGVKKAMDFIDRWFPFAKAARNAFYRDHGLEILFHLIDRQRSGLISDGKNKGVRPDFFSRVKLSTELANYQKR